ncbi:MAG: hypothetical protein R3B48_18490 [Kofleriaceae bacterium]
MGPAFAPTGAWLEAFEAQVTAPMLSRVRRYASKLAQAVVHAGGVGGAFYAHELVQDALGDTLAGVLRWDPEVVNLEGHLCSRVRSRAGHARAAAALGRHEWLDAHERDGDRVRTEVEGALARDAPNPEAQSHAQRAVAQVRRAAVGDAAVQRLLDAIEAGVEDRRELVVATGLSAKEYRNARLRLRRLCRAALGKETDETSSCEGIQGKART